MHSEIKRFGQTVEVAASRLLASRRSGECSALEARLALQGAMVLMVRTIEACRVADADREAA